MSRITTTTLLVVLTLVGAACTGSTSRTMRPRDVTLGSHAVPHGAETSCAGEVCFVYADER
jgi:hypothetical protein